MHSTSDMNDGYIGSGKRLWLSINKHGKENHSLEIIEFLPNRESLKIRESELVNEDLLKDPMCMNLQPGGGGGLTTEEHANKFHSAGGRKTGKSNGKINSSNTFKKLHQNNRIKYDVFKGKNHTDETKKKIGESVSNKQRGQQNSQFRTLWITQNGMNKKIQMSQLNEYLNLGWIKGRKLK